MYLAVIVRDNFVLYSRLKIKREIRSVVLIILNSKRYVVSFPKASFNIAIARTKALYMLAWNGMRSGCSSVPCNAAYTGCMYVRVNARSDVLPACTVASNSDDIVPYLRIRGAVLRGLD